MRYKIKRNRRKWGISAQYDSRRQYVNRRLRIKGRFISKVKVVRLLFGEDGKPDDYSFEELTNMLNMKFRTGKLRPEDLLK